MNMYKLKIEHKKPHFAWCEMRFLLYRFLNLHFLSIMKLCFLLQKPKFLYELFLDFNFSFRNFLFRLISDGYLNLLLLLIRARENSTIFLAES